MDYAELAKRLRGDCYDGGCHSCTACLAADAIEAQHKKLQAVEALCESQKAFTTVVDNPHQMILEDKAACHVCKSMLEYRTSGPLPGCPQGFSSYVCPVNPMHGGEPMQSDEAMFEAQMETENAVGSFTSPEVRAFHHGWKAFAALFSKTGKLQ